MSKASVTQAGNTLWSKIPKANAELFALTYGALVTELVRDYDNNIPEINNQLERIGHSIGVRCVDELFAKSELNNVTIPTCKDIKDTAEVIAKVGFRMFLGMTCEVGNMAPDGKTFSLFLHENPLGIFVELPESEYIEGEGGEGANRGDDGDAVEGAGISGPDWSKLKYSNVYCGVIRGALEQVNMKVECDFVKDLLRGDDVNEIRVELKEIMQDGAGDDYKDE